jgi:cell division transport system permease protein
MITVISRIIHYGFKNFWRNGLLSTATVAIVTLCLMVFAGLIMANAMAGHLIGYLQDKIDIAVYFKNATPEDQILSVRSSLEGLPTVRAVDYVSAEQALVNFKERHKDEPAIGQSLDELNANPLQASLNVKAKDPNNYKDIADYLATPDLAQYIDSITYNKNQVVIDRLASIIGGVERAGLIITIILSLIAGLVVFNTIRLVIYSNRDEITIMRAVGASNMFVRGPYLMEGVIIGMIAAVASLLLILIALLGAPLVIKGGSLLDLSGTGFDLTGYFLHNLHILLGYQVLFGVGLTVISSFIAVRRYLKN